MAYGGGVDGDLHVMARDRGSTTGEGNRMRISQLKIKFFSQNMNGKGNVTVWIFSTN